MSRKLSETEIALSLNNGGRSLNAIWTSRLDATQKFVMQFLASRLDFRGTFTEGHWTPILDICEGTSLSRRTVQITLHSLAKAGYLTIKARFGGATGQLANEYALTLKIFEEYRLRLLALQAEKDDASLKSNEEAVKGQEDQAPPPRHGDTPPRADSAPPPVHAVHPPRADSAPPPCKICTRIPQENSLIEENTKTEDIFSASTDAGENGGTEGSAVEGAKATSPASSQPLTACKAKPAKRAGATAGARYRPMSEEKAQRARARKALALVYRPSEREKARFFDKVAVEATADLALERYGIETIEAIRDAIIADEKCGKIPFDANVFLKACAQHAELKAQEATE